jgi:two-component system OmpR family sensor kinase
VGLLPRTLSGRLVATTVLLVAAVGLLVTLATTLVMRDFLVGQLDEELRQSAQRSAGMLLSDAGRLDPGGPGGGSPGPDGPGGRAPGAPGTLTAYYPAGAEPTGVIAGTDDARLSSAALDRLDQVPADGQVHAVDVPGRGGYRVLAVSAGDEKVVTGLSTANIDDTTESLLAWQLLLTACGVGAAALAGDLLVRRTLRPLRQVARTAQEVTRLPLDTGQVGQTLRVPAELTDPGTEVGQVGSSLNQLLGHVENALDARHRSEQQVRQFVADASHELRTPLATISGYAQLARRNQSYDAQQALAKVEGEADRMSTLVEDLLLLARLDAGRPLERTPVDLTRLLLEAVGDARVVAPDHRWTLDLPDHPVTVTGDEARLHQVVSNLLGNARRHTPAGTSVRVRLHARDEQVELSVSDDGPGVPAALQPNVFERFTRADTARTRDSGGAGLGLSLVAAIVAAHGGTVTLDSAPGATTFTVTLPAPG